MLEHGARARTGVFFNFNGTAGMWRRQAIDDAGGWQHDTLTEDTDLSYRSQIAGWKFKYLPDVECPAELPIEMTAFKTQQARWAKGLIQTSEKDSAAGVPSRTCRAAIKIEAVYHLTANLSYPLMIVLSALLMPAMIIRFYQGWFQMLLIDVPLFMASTFSISSLLPGVAEASSSRRPGCKTFLYLPFLMALGIGLTVTNTKAVMEALFGIKSASCARPSTAWPRRAKDRRPPSTASAWAWLPWIELLIGCYFFADRLLRLHERELLHRAVPDSVRDRLLVHRPDVAAAGPLRAPLLRQRSRDPKREAVSGRRVTLACQHALNYCVPQDLPSGANV